MLSTTKETPVSGKAGPLGVITQTGDASGQAHLRLLDGREVLVPASYLTERADGTYFLPLTTEQLASTKQEIADYAETIVPVIAEDLVVEKQQVPSGGVRIRKVVQEHDETVGMSLYKEHTDIRRVLIDHDVDGPQPIRRDGDTVVVPVVEEVLVVEKRFRLKEELHITKRSSHEQTEQTVTLHREHAIIERLDADGRVVGEEAPMDAPASLSTEGRPSLLGERQTRPVRHNRILPDPE